MVNSSGRIGVIGRRRVDFVSSDSRCKDVASARHGFDVLDCAVIQRSPDIPDALEQRIVGDEGIVPRCGQQFFFSDDTPVIFNEVSKQLKTFGTKLDFLTLSQELPAPQIKNKAGECPSLGCRILRCFWAGHREGKSYNSGEQNQNRYSDQNAHFFEVEKSDDSKRRSRTLRKRNIRAIARLENEALHQRSFTDRVSDSIKRFAGSSLFILLHITVVHDLHALMRELERQLPDE